MESEIDRLIFPCFESLNYSLKSFYYEIKELFLNIKNLLKIKNILNYYEKEKLKKKIIFLKKKLNEIFFISYKNYLIDENFLFYHLILILILKCFLSSNLIIFESLIENNNDSRRNLKNNLNNNSSCKVSNGKINRPMTSNSKSNSEINNSEISSNNNKKKTRPRSSVGPRIQRITPTTIPPTTITTNNTGNNRNNLQDTIHPNENNPSSSSSNENYTSSSHPNPIEIDIELLIDLTCDCDVTLKNILEDYSQKAQNNQINIIKDLILLFPEEVFINTKKFLMKISEDDSHQIITQKINETPIELPEGPPLPTTNTTTTTTTIPRSTSLGINWGTAKSLTLLPLIQSSKSSNILRLFSRELPSSQDTLIDDKH